MIADFAKVALMDGTARAAIDLQPGAEVMTVRNHKMGPVALVERTVENHDDVVCLILASGQRIIGSRDQRISVWRKERNWYTEMSNVEPGMYLSGQGQRDARHRPRHRRHVPRQAAGAARRPHVPQEGVLRRGRDTVSLVSVKRRAEGLKYEDETFTKLDLRSMKAFGSGWTNCSFVECHFDLADLRSSKFTDCTFQNCSLRLVNFGASFFDETKFFDCDMEQASFIGSQFRGGTFDGCRMAYGETMFLDTTLRGKVVFSVCNFHGSNMDFREVEPGALNFSDCNFWGARVSLGCAFWLGHFDHRAIQQFVALMARASQDQRLKEYAGDQYGVVSRAMDGQKGPKAVPEAKEG